MRTAVGAGNDALNFLREYGAHRVGGYGDAPQLIAGGAPGGPDSDKPSDETNEGERLELGYESDKPLWKPISVRRTAAPPSDWPLRPVRFVDGKDVGRVVAWLKSPGENLPVPLRLAQIGAVALRCCCGAAGSDNGGACLRCETRRVERVVTFMADLFPWHEVEGFTAALQAHGFRLLICRSPAEGENPFEFERLRARAHSRTINEMFGLERDAMAFSSGVPTVIDGSLQTKSGAFAPTDPATGVVKTHTNIDLHPRGWQVVQDLGPGERTPAFGRDVEDLRFVSWYLRLGPGARELPSQAIVRVEISRAFFENVAGGDPVYLNQLSRCLCDGRCRDGGYQRAAVTLHPIQRAEDALRARFAAQDTLASHFYHLTQL